MKVAITGSKGFIGARLASYCREKGISVFGLDEKKHDLSNPETLGDFVSDKDVIVHLAASNRGTSRDLIVGNVMLTYNLLAAARKYNSKAKIIYSSSIQAANDSVYGSSKRLAEELLKDYAKELRVPVTIFRIANVFGEACRPFYNSVVATFCYQAAHGGTIKIKKGNKPITLIYVQDVIKAIFKEMNAKRKNPCFCKVLTSDNLVDIEELAGTIASFKDLDPRRASAVLKTKFKKDLYLTYRWYVQNPNWPENI